MNTILENDITPNQLASVCLMFVAKDQFRNDDDLLREFSDKVVANTLEYCNLPINSKFLPLIVGINVCLEAFRIGLTKGRMAA